MALTKEQLGTLLQIDAKVDEAARLEQEMSEPAFWQDIEQARRISQRYASLQKLIERYLAAETEANLTALETETLFTGPHDEAPALVAIHAGAGGTEAQDWAQILKRMYERFAEAQGWPVAIFDQSLGEEAGIKSAILRIEGERAYGWLKGEAGVHRLVRMSPFDADHARHTSFALVEVTPELTDTPQVVIDEKDLRIDLFRSGGKGGQNVNKVETAIRITHQPTGIVVSCQMERSQAQNRERAMQMLRSRLAVLMEKERAAGLKELRGEYHSAEWGNQIRSYVLQPYQLVKDHRTNVETSQTEAVLNGEITPFLEGYLRRQAVDKSEATNSKSETGHQA